MKLIHSDDSGHNTMAKSGDQLSTTLTSSSARYNPLWFWFPKIGWRRVQIKAYVVADQAFNMVSSCGEDSVVVHGVG